MTVQSNKVLLLPGEYYISRKPHEISTLLGSCVAVCLYNRRNKFGGMNHYMLPTSGMEPQSPKYGDFSIGLMIRFMKEQSGSLEGVEAMIFGGARLMSAPQTGANIGEANLAMARNMLREHHIPITRSQVGGNSGLKIRYQTWDNQVQWRPLDSSQYSPDPREFSLVVDKKIQILVVDASAWQRSILARVIESEEDMTVIGQVGDAYEARALLLEKEPDVLVMDVVMPNLDGLVFLKRIMAYYPKPVVVVSSLSQAGPDMEKRATKVGAVAVIDKDTLDMHQNLASNKDMILEKIRQASRTLVAHKTRAELVGI
jgi:chemotaxis protein CheD